MKLRKFSDLGYLHWCPACDQDHIFAVEKPYSNGAQWTFNGDFERPTFNPSMKIEWPNQDGLKRCHYFLHDGSLKFCSDCTHSMANQTVPLPEIPEGE